MAKDKPIKINDKDDVKKTYVHIILDKSGSMQIIRAETISHFNEQVQELQKKTTEDMETMVSLTVFDGEVEHKFLRQPVKSLQEIGPKDYRPSGSTALYDAVGQALDDLERKAEDINDDNVAVLMIILSDGEENSSTMYTQEIIASRIKKLRATDRWTFVYIGANQDLEVVAKKLAIPRTNMLQYTSDRLGTKGMNQVHVASVGNYMCCRAAGAMSLDADFYNEDDQAKVDLSTSSKTSDPNPDVVTPSSTSGSSSDGK
jgi:uncharacterized protein YegL